MQLSNFGYSLRSSYLNKSSYYIYSNLKTKESKLLTL